MLIIIALILALIGIGLLFYSFSNFQFDSLTISGLIMITISLVLAYLHDSKSDAKNEKESKKREAERQKRSKKDRAELDAYLKRKKKKEQKQLEKNKKEKEENCKKIISFLKKEGTKLPASDIDFQLRIGDVDLVKELCEEMYRDKKIGRTGNYRYFV